MIRFKKNVFLTLIILSYSHWALPPAHALPPPLSRNFWIQGGSGGLSQKVSSLNVGGTPHSYTSPTRHAILGFKTKDLLFEAVYRKSDYPWWLTGTVGFAMVQREFFEMFFMLGSEAYRNNLSKDDLKYIGRYEAPRAGLRMNWMLFKSIELSGQGYATVAEGLLKSYVSGDLRIWIFSFFALGGGYWQDKVEDSSDGASDVTSGVDAFIRFKF